MEKNKYSLVIGGVLVSVLGSLLVAFGLTESCSSEIVAKIMPLLPVIVGGGMSYVGRQRLGGVTPLGFKNDNR